MFGYTLLSLSILRQVLAVIWLRYLAASLPLQVLGGLPGAGVVRFWMFFLGGPGKMGTWDLAMLFARIPAPYSLRASVFC